jgi:hypothetical protein
LKWLGILLASVAFGPPAIPFLVALVLVQGHAGIAYFEAVAQIIPIVILALAIELRYFSPARQPPKTLGLLFRDPARARVVPALRAVDGGRAAGIARSRRGEGT